MGFFGFAASRALRSGESAPRWVVGLDTRESGPALTEDLAFGLTRAGSDVLLVGIVPTPVVAFAAKHLDACGAVVTASHNRWTDNGLKLFARGGTKLDDDAEKAVTNCLRELLEARLSEGDEAHTAAASAETQSNELTSWEAAAALGSETATAVKDGPLAESRGASDATRNRLGSDHLEPPSGPTARTDQA